MDRPLDHEYQVDPAAQAQPEPPVGERPPDGPDRLEPILAPAATSDVAAVSAADCGCGAPPAEQALSEPGNNYVYVLGQIGFRFPNPAVEKEVARAVARSASREPTARQAVCRVISKPEHRYLARQLCYVLSGAEGVPGGLHSRLRPRARPPRCRERPVRSTASPARRG